MRSRPGGRSHQPRYVSSGGNGGAHDGSPTAGPAIASRSAAASRTVRASGPDVPRPTGAPYIGAPLIRPPDGFSPNSPQQLGGRRTAPPPWGPWARGPGPAAPAAAAPPLDPPAIRSRSQGVRAGGATSGSV